MTSQTFPFGDQDHEKLYQFLQAHPCIDWIKRPSGSIRALFIGKSHTIQFRIYFPSINRIELQRRRGPVLEWNGLRQMILQRQRMEKERADTWKEIVLDRHTMENLWSMIETNDCHLAGEAWGHVAMMAESPHNHSCILGVIRSKLSALIHVLLEADWRWEMRLWCLIMLDRLNDAQLWSELQTTLTILQFRLNPQRLQDMRALKIVCHHLHTSSNTK